MRHSARLVSRPSRFSVVVKPCERLLPPGYHSRFPTGWCIIWWSYVHSKQGAMFMTRCPSCRHSHQTHCYGLSCTVASSLLYWHMQAAWAYGTASSQHLPIFNMFDICQLASQGLRNDGATPRPKPIHIRGHFCCKANQMSHNMM